MSVEASTDSQASKPEVTVASVASDITKKNLEKPPVRAPLPNLTLDEEA